jgi:antitoxin component HigA of HigAB toxin-antitoxin module
MATRFSELSENELSCLLEEKNAEITKKVTKAAVNVFRQYLEARQINEDDLVVGSKETLANVLRKF